MFISLLTARLNLPKSFARWEDLEAPASFECIHEGPTVLQAQTFKRWKEEYRSWRKAYQEFLKAERSLLEQGQFRDDFDRRHYEHFAALILQSGQWRASLLLLLKDIDAAERARLLAEIDGILADCRKRIAKP